MVLHALQAERLIEDFGGQVSLLQQHLVVGTDADDVSTSALEASSSDEVQLESLLRQAGEECPQSSEACLSILTDLRTQLWPYVQEEANWSGAAWLPSGMDSEQAMGEISCSQNKTMYYRHIWKSAGHSVFENLEQVTTHFRQDGMSYSEFCQNFNSLDDREHAAFTFVRDPISRFISGYAEIEHRTRDGVTQYADLATTLSQHPVGSPERAAAFFKEFLRTGINLDGHVKPQLEFLLPNGGCSVPMNFIGKTNSMEEDWTRMFRLQECSLSAPFDEHLGLHPNDQADKVAMEISLGLESDRATDSSGDVATNTSSELMLVEATADMRALVAALQQDRSKYLRALCWLLLPDFAAFNFKLPAACQQGQLRSLLQPRRGESDQQ